MTSLEKAFAEARRLPHLAHGSGALVISHVTARFRNAFDSAIQSSGPCFFVAALALVLKACYGSGPIDGEPATTDTGSESDSDSDSESEPNVHHAPCNGFHAIHGSGPGEVWVGGSCGMIHNLTGDDWVDRSVAADVHVRGIWSPEPGRALAVGFRCSPGGCGEFTAVMLSFENGGWHEEQIEAPPSSSLLAVWGSSPDDVWAAGWGGLILRGDGASWSKVPPPSAEGFDGVHLVVMGIHGSTANAVYLAGFSRTCVLYEDCTPCGELWRWNGVGFEFAWVSSCEWMLQDVWVAPSDHVFAVSTYGRAVVGEGEDWQKMYADDEHRDFSGVWARNENDVFAVGYRSLALGFDGESWSALPQVPGDINLRDVWGESETVWAVGREQLDSAIPAGECDPEKRAVVLEFDGTAWTEVLSLPPC